MIQGANLLVALHSDYDVSSSQDGELFRGYSNEFLGFMATVVAAFPDRELHVILDNLNTHKKNERWLKKHPRVHFHFTPTRASCLNQVET
jgi:hypothetical protein